jgi:inhibitor of KinA
VRAISNFRIIPCGDTAIVVEFGDQIDRDLSRTVLRSTATLRQAQIQGIVEVVPTFRSLLVHYNPLITTSSKLIEEILPIMQGEGEFETQARCWHLPVCYEGVWAPDLDDVARRTEMTTQDVIRMHVQNTYHIYMVGFLPGYPYMGDLPEQLRLPRREIPRVRVPAGSVAIATAMTAVYPIESPGGWHLIGATPVPMFDKNVMPPALFTAGDQVIFFNVNSKELAIIEADIQTGTYVLSCEDVHS